MNVQVECGTATSAMIYEPGLVGHVADQLPAIAAANRRCKCGHAKLFAGAKA